MEVTGTKEAFLKILGEKNVHLKLGVSQPTTSNWRRAVLEGKNEKGNVTIDKMEEMLLKYGASVAHEKIWNLNKEM